MGCLFSKPAAAEVDEKAAQYAAPAEPTPTPIVAEVSAPESPKAGESSSALATKPPHVPQANSALRGQIPGARSEPRSESGSHGLGHADEAENQHRGKSGRRAAAGSEAVRDQIRKLAIGGNKDSSTDDGPSTLYTVSDSEDESVGSRLEDSEGDWDIKPPELSRAICEALKRNVVFRGISEALLLKVVSRMFGVSFLAGSTVLQQGKLPAPDDCLYFLEQGEADVAISGAVENSMKGREEQQEVIGRTIRIPQRPGWVFGDVALLFNSARTASVVARTNITVWALQRATFLQFVMTHAQGARALRFLRKLPLLKGLSDNDLIRAAVKMPQRTYQPGETLIKYGERGEELFLIRYGKVRVLRPDGNGGRATAVVLGRGQFVGERAVINNKLRSADCVAEGPVTVVVMKKRDFMDLDNPLLSWMMDYDAISTCLRFVPYLKLIKHEQMEQMLDQFDAKEVLYEGQEVLHQGDMVDRMYVIKLGEVQLLQDGAPVSALPMVREGGGFSFFGEAALQQPFVSPYTVVVTSDVMHVLTLSKRQLDHFLGVESSLSTPESVLQSLRKSKALQGLSDSQLRQLVESAQERSFNAGEVIVSPVSGPCKSLFLIKGGAGVMVPAGGPQAGAAQVHLSQVEEKGRLVPGALFNEEALQSEVPSVPACVLVAATPGTTVLTIGREDLELVLGGLSQQVAPKRRLNDVKFEDLEFHRIIGTGQFGAVRLVRSTKTNDVYALKIMHKGPITDPKQMEHILNERKCLEEAVFPFCVQLRGAYQDKLCLYLLQEWVPGGELFHYLDLEGAFDEAASMFYAANVLLALDFLHSKGYVYRDLKPENLLIDAQGYLKMADFGFAKTVGKEKTFTICGTPDYQAPEVIMRQGTTRSADYWGLGVLIFEMLVGDPPFKSLMGDPWDTFRRTLSGRFYVPKFVSDAASDIIFKLLHVNPDKRLGMGPGGVEEIKQHRFFSRIDWDALAKRRVRAPMIPKIRNPLDTSNFDNFDGCEVDPPPVPQSLVEKQPTWDMWDPI